MISNASGQLGRGVVEEALQRVDADELILVTRAPADLANYADLGASVRYGDFDQPATRTWGICPVGSASAFSTRAFV